MQTNTCHRAHLSHRDRIRNHTKGANTCISYEVLLVKKREAQGLCPLRSVRVQAHVSTLWKGF